MGLIINRLPTIRELDRLSVIERSRVLEAHVRDLRAARDRLGDRPVEAEVIRRQLRLLYRIGAAFGVRLTD